MDQEEAIQDAIEVCELQGGSLFYVIKKCPESDGRHLILHLVDRIIENPSEDNLKSLADECKLFEVRHYAAEHYKAHQKLAELLNKLDYNDANRQQIVLYTKALCKILTGQPDWVDNFLILLIRKYCDQWIEVSAKSEVTDGDWEFVAAISYLISTCSKKHEGKK